MARDSFMLHAEAILRTCCKDDEDDLDQSFNAELPHDPVRLWHLVQCTQLIMKHQMGSLTSNERIRLGQHTRELLLSDLSNEQCAKTIEQGNDDNDKTKRVACNTTNSTPSTVLISIPEPSSSHNINRSGAISPKIFRRTKTAWKSPLDHHII